VTTLASAAQTPSITHAYEHHQDRLILKEGLSDSFKYALVVGAVTGGGLTIIANAPNPAGIAILRQHFDEGVVHPIGLLVAALPPTLVAAAAFWLL
jgi:Na+/H+ antiporter NhaD/arsenite permease-like protein